MMIKALIPKYLTELKVLNRSPLTIRSSRYSLLDLERFLKEMKVYGIEQLHRDVLTEYQQDLAFRLTAKGKLLSPQSQTNYLKATRGFTRFIYENDYLARDPGIEIRSPKTPKRLPRAILDQSEIKRMFSSCNMQTNLSFRDRIILEVLYDTGVRASELLNIKTSALDLDGGYISIQSGKGDKDRVVPVSSRVCSLIRDYLLVIRPAMLRGKDEGCFILNRTGKQMGVSGLWLVIKRCSQQAKIKKNITTHTFRHTCASHMLTNGAPIRHIQELLGHESLESTQIYTRVTINDLKAVHAKYHPGESLPAR